MEGHIRNACEKVLNGVPFMNEMDALAKWAAHKMSALRVSVQLGTISALSPGDKNPDVAKGFTVKVFQLLGLYFVVCLFFVEMISLIIYGALKVLTSVTGRQFLPHRTVSIRLTKALVQYVAAQFLWTTTRFYFLNMLGQESPLLFTMPVALQSVKPALIFVSIFEIILVVLRMHRSILDGLIPVLVTVLSIFALMFESELPIAIVCVPMLYIDSMISATNSLALLNGSLGAIGAILHILAVMCAKAKGDVSLNGVFKLIWSTNIRGKRLPFPTIFEIVSLSLRGESGSDGYRSGWHLSFEEQMHLGAVIMGLIAALELSCLTNMILELIRTFKNLRKKVTPESYANGYVELAAERTAEA